VLRTRDLTCGGGRVSWASAERRNEACREKGRGQKNAVILVLWKKSRGDGCPGRRPREGTRPAGNSRGGRAEECCHLSALEEKQRGLQGIAEGEGRRELWS